MKLYNTASKEIERFEPLNPPNITLYTCGPTVYDYTHLGHLRSYTNNDVLKRVLKYFGYKVKHVMNVTDVGHLTDDNDSGEDKMEKGATKKGVTVWDLARTYTDYFIYSISALNISKPDILANATDNIKEIIDFIKILEKKHFTYETKEAVYFNISKFPAYGKLSGQKLEDKIRAARSEVYTDPDKNNPADFALWFKRVGKFANHSMHWPSPWGDGFPGWHIECSAIISKYLGPTIDIHAGGVDHIAAHHENEMAQSEGANEKPFVKYWFHNEFLTSEGKKMSKSLGNFFTIDSIKDKGFEPLALRLLFLQTHYRQIMNFTWESLSASEIAYKKLKAHAQELMSHLKEVNKQSEYSSEAKNYKQKFADAIYNDIQMPKAVATLWDMLRSGIPAEEKLHLIMDFDDVLGLDIVKPALRTESIPEEIIKLAQEREEARMLKEFGRADKIREQINKKGWAIKDTDHGFDIVKR